MLWRPAELSVGVIERLGSPVIRCASTTVAWLKVMVLEGLVFVVAAFPTGAEAGCATGDGFNECPVPAEATGDPVSKIGAAATTAANAIGCRRRALGRTT